MWHRPHSMHSWSTTPTTTVIVGWYFSHTTKAFNTPASTRRKNTRLDLRHYPPTRLHSESVLYSALCLNASPIQSNISASSGSVKFPAVASHWVKKKQSGENYTYQISRTVFSQSYCTHAIWSATGMIMSSFCRSVCMSMTLCTVAKRYILQHKANAKVSARQPWYIRCNSLNRPPLRIALQYQRTLYIVEKYFQCATIPSLTMLVYLHSFD